MGKAKAQGTRRETWFVRKAEAAGLTARRYENNAPGRDVDIEADTLRIFEVKDRANLNIHKTLADTINRWPGLPAAVVWHRLSRKDGNTKRTPDGPTIVALPVDDYLALLAAARKAAE